MARAFKTFCQEYRSLFWCFNRDQTEHAHRYLCGLLQSVESNLLQMADAVPGFTYQDEQHFVSDSPWDHEAVMTQVARQAYALLGGQRDTALLLDETCFAKKGEKSVGVARQYNGRLGKVDNCQVGVVAAISAGRHAVPVAATLYLPESWTSDPERCAQAGVPADRRALRTKIELALTLVEQQLALGHRFAWVGADAGYGRDLAFCLRLEALEQTFLVDIPSDRQVYREAPTGRGDAPKPLEVRDWVAGTEEAWRRVEVRHSTKGRLTVEAQVQSVWLWDEEAKLPRGWLLVARRDGPDAEIKYSLTNARPTTGLARLAAMAHQRYWIERVFEDAKSQVGMAEYQVHSWLGWHHHLALVLMACLFLTRFRLLHAEEKPLLSAADVRLLLEHFLPRPPQTTEAVLARMADRHRRRQAAIAHAQRHPRRRGRRIINTIITK
jgi:SRSO17 transposase